MAFKYDIIQEYTETQQYFRKDRKMNFKILVLVAVMFGSSIAFAQSRPTYEKRESHSSYERSVKDVKNDVAWYYRSSSAFPERRRESSFKIDLFGLYKSDWSKGSDTQSYGQILVDPVTGTTRRQVVTETRTWEHKKESKAPLTFRPRNPGNDGRLTAKLLGVQSRDEIAITAYPSTSAIVPAITTPVITITNVVTVTNMVTKVEKPQKPRVVHKLVIPQFPTRPKN